MLAVNAAALEEQAVGGELAERAVADYRASLPPERQPLLSRYEFKDAALKVVGVGSVGTLCGIMLLMSGNGDPLFLQFKEARESVLEPYAGASPYRHHGQRVVVGQRLMQAASDIFLGWFTGTGPDKRQFYVRQLRDAKVSPLIDAMQPQNLIGYAKACGIAATDVTNYLAWARKELRTCVLVRLREITHDEDEFKEEARAVLGVDP